MSKIQQPITSRVFLVGCPRSGTTLLQSLLAAHPQIMSFPESHLLTATGQTRRGRWYTRLGFTSPEIRQTLDQFLTNIGHNQLRARLKKNHFRLESFVTKFVEILDHLTISQGKTIWLEKTPGHLHYVRYFERYIPGVKFIHLIRSGEDAVASLYDVTHRYPEQWGGPYSLAQCVARWNQDMRLTQRYAQRANHAMLAYENLVSRPADVLTNLCNFLGVSFLPAQIGQHQIASKSLVLAHEVWKDDNFQPIRIDRERKFTALFDQKQQAYILDKLHHFNL